ncbi:hypothetical protein ABZX98_02790 [Streptomyces sp. NPDC002992]|uniref:hypothetical protein n=1 Tax=Streptomyces sp. NPDC002992 TaxID=3154273 RepID=UPI0033B9B7E4
MQQARGKQSVAVGGDAGVVVTGDHNQVVTAPPVRSAYWEQVRRIAPAELVDREEELAALSAFCRAESGPAYTWWRAEAWAGKTALLSWFALNPPEGVRIVPFFITARLGAQNDVVAYVDVVLEQLAELVGEGLPAHLTAATREAHLLRLYSEAARICAEHRECLVLLVDGLDEDRGVTTGPDAHSIASLLPHAAGRSLKVIVAGRLNPPLPGDVSSGHPLRDPAIVRAMAPSPHARAVRSEAERELKTFLADDRHARDLLGLVIAAEGGLTAGDLAHLTGSTPFAVKDLLRSRAGRTLTAREAHFAAQSEEVGYLLGHEELQRLAKDMLGDRALDAYRDRLHAWYEEFRDRGWPLGTPMYLLRGYFRMLRARDDTIRLINCALDTVRHDRMLDVTGSDAAALVELREAGEVITEAGGSFLPDMLRISIRRHDLEGRTSRIPALLPAAWVNLGDTRRAKALADGIHNREERAEALIAMEQALARRGEVDPAAECLADARDVARRLPETSARGRVIARILRACLRAGRFDQARSLAREGSDLPMASPELVAVIDALAKAGESDRLAAAVTTLTRSPRTNVDDVAAAFAELGHVEQSLKIARGLRHPTERSVTLLRIAGVLRRRQHEREATELIDEALAGGVESLGDAVVRALAAAGEVDAAEARARAMAHTGRRSAALAGIIEELAAFGAFGRIDVLLRLVADESELSRAASTAARAAAARGNTDLCERLARLITDDQALSDALAALAEALVLQGRVDEGVQIATMLTEQDGRVEPLVQLSVTLAATGAEQRARECLTGVETRLRHAKQPQETVRRMTAVAEALVRVGLVAEGCVVLDEAESLLKQAAVRPGHTTVGDEPVYELVRVLVRAGLLERAEKLAAAESDPALQDRLFTVVGRAMVECGRFEDAIRLAGVPVRRSWSRLAAEVAHALAEAGELLRAVAVTEGAMAPHHRAWVMAEIAYLHTVAGRRDDAAEWFHSARTQARRAPSTHAAASLVRAAIVIGDVETAQLQAAEAEALLGNFRTARGEMRAAVRAMAELGDCDRAEALIRRIYSPVEYAVAQADLVEEFVAVGQVASAEAIAASMRPGREVARAYGALARSSERPRARQYLALALQQGWWTQCLADVVSVEPGTARSALEALD